MRVEYASQHTVTGAEHGVVVITLTVFEASLLYKGARVFMDTMRRALRYYVTYKGKW